MMDCFHFTIKCFIADVKEQSKHQWIAEVAVFQWGFAKQERIVLDHPPSEMLHSSYKYGQTHMFCDAYFFFLVF